MYLTTDQLGLVNAAVAHLMKVYGDKPEVPQGALDKYNDGRGLRFSVAHFEGRRHLSVNNGFMMIELGYTPAPTQPNAPTSGSGEIESEPLRKAA